MVSGSIPNQNLPTKSLDRPTKERRTLVRASIDDKPSVSTFDVPALTLKNFEKEISAQKTYVTMDDEIK